VIIRAAPATRSTTQPGCARFNHFYRVRQAMDSRESFFNDDNLARIMAAAAA
jgi:hypothetical protein